MLDNPLQCGKVYWCPTCEVPLLTIMGEEPKCDICRSKEGKPRYAASDMRPVFEPERELLASKLHIKIPKNIFYNRRRIIYRGQTLFFFTLRDGEIVLRKENPTNYVRREDLEGYDYEEYLKKTVRANTTVLRRLEQEAVDFISKTVEQYPGRQHFVSFSGGKDSAVVATLVQETLGDVSLFFADTTLEHEETIHYIKSFAEEHSLSVETRASQNDFFDMSRKLDPPSRIMRWCCSVFKAYPINLFWGSLDDYVLGFDGIRKAESRSRNGYPRIFQSEKFIRQVAARPILHWSSLAVWLYTYYKELSFNPLYKRGYTRIGCFLCPYNTDYDDFLNSYYEIPRWQQWLDFLKNYAEQQYKHRSEEWIDAWVHQGYWKQRKPRKRTEYVVSQDSDNDTALLYVFTNGIPPNLPEFLKPICSIKTTTDGAVFRSCHRESRTRLAGRVGGGVLTIIVPEREQPKEFQRLVERQIEKAVNCVGCGGCIGICPHKAISLNDRGIVIDNEVCCHENCRLCVTTDIGGSGYSCIAMSYKAFRRRISRNGQEVSVSRL
jgi:phosphoadenosine phosphosulfate reductase